MYFFFADEDDTFRNSPYLSTAMRLSVPGISREPSEEEIMKDVDNLEPLKYDSSRTFQKSNQPLWSLKGLTFENIADGLKDDEKSTRRSKRYHEFLGKRADEFQSGNPQKGEELAKRWSEFVGKRGNNGWVVSPALVSKRYIEFIGKREPLRYRSPEKKYSEFLG